MNIQSLRSYGIAVLAFTLAGAAQAADGPDLKTMGFGAVKSNYIAKLERLALVSSSLHEMAESLDDIAIEVDRRIEQLAANYAQLQVAQASN